jgi:hypothetical protein
MESPTLTAELRAAAKQQPGSWLYAVDPAYDGKEDVPPHAIVGAWQVDDDGEITQPFLPNPEYVPSDATEKPEKSEMPPIPDDIRAAAKNAPDHWIGMVDPAWTGEPPPPVWALVGQWRSDEHGEIVEWQANDEYRPSPDMLGLPEPADPVDAAVQLAATGYGPAEEVPRLLAGAELAVFVGQHGEPVTATAPDGTPVVPAFTAKRYLEAAGALAAETVPVAELVDRIPDGHQLYLNPTGPVAMRVEMEPLRAAIADRTQDANPAAATRLTTADES